MTSTERRSLAALAGVYMLRMLGLFMLLPVMALYAEELVNSTPLLVGLSLGIYGLSQGLLQIPFGMASDRWGRKQVIILGLSIFIIGSVVAALATSIHMLIAGRAIQGAGAISAAVLALTADLTREQHRTRAMALIGVSIGFVFLLSLIVAPLLQQAIGVPGIFWMTAGLGLLAIFVVRFVVPDPERHLHHRDIAPETGQIRAILGDGNLLRLDIGIFVLHMVLTALFVGLPGMLQAKTGLPVGEHWKLYIPVLVLSVVAMVPLVVLGSRNRTTALAYRIAIVVLMVALALLAWTGDLGMWPLLGAVFVFFTAFNALEAMLPSLISRLAPAAGKGTAIGVYNSFQFVGMFAGGVAAGYLGTHYGPASVYWFCALVVAVWAVVAMTAPAFRLSRSEIVPIGTCTDSQRTELIDKIRSIDGVQEVTIVKGDSVAYLKIDDETFDRTQLQQLIRT